MASSEMSTLKVRMSVPVWTVLMTTSLTQGLECGANLFGEQLRLLPRCEVAALVDLVEVDEVGIGALHPAPRRLVCLVRKDAHGHRNGDALGVPEAALVLPVQPRRRHPRVRQPEERDVVEDVVTRQLARRARGPLQRRDHLRRRLAAAVIVVEKPGSQADG